MIALLSFNQFRKVLFETTSLLRPAIRKDGRIVIGRAGATHGTTAKRFGIDHVFSDSDIDTGFVDPKGNFLDRREAYKFAHRSFLLSKTAAKDAMDLYTKYPDQYNQQRLDTTDLKNSRLAKGWPHHDRE
jgi:hypothetical protein